MRGRCAPRRTLPSVDDVAVGRLLRAIRIRRGWRQADVAVKAGMHRSQVSRAERGLLEDLRLGDLRRIGAVLEVRTPLAPTWRGGDADRLVNAGHVALQGAILGQLPPGWSAIPEAPLVGTERGVVDLVAWHQESRSLLLIEVKTELADPGALVAQVSRYRRALPALARAHGWEGQACVGTWVAIADSSMNRRRLALASALLRRAFPQGGYELRRWLLQPRGDLAALSFVSNALPGSTRRSGAPVRRVRLPRARAGRQDHLPE